MPIEPSPCWPCSTSTNGDDRSRDRCVRHEQNAGKFPASRPKTGHLSDENSIRITISSQLTLVAKLCGGLFSASLGNAMATSEPITAMAIIISMIVKARCLVLRRVCTEERIDALRNSCDAGESASKSSCITTVRYLQPFCIITRACSRYGQNMICSRYGNYRSPISPDRRLPAAPAR